MSYEPLWRLPRSLLRSQFGLPPPGPADDCPLCRIPPSLARTVPLRASTAASKSADHGALSDDVVGLSVILPQFCYCPGLR